MDSTIFLIFDAIPGSAAGLRTRSGMWVAAGLVAWGCGFMFTPAAAAQRSFTEEALLRGIDYQPSLFVPFGAGVAFVDLDADDDPDIVATGNVDGLLGLFENLGDGHFIDRSWSFASTGLPVLIGVAAADYDRDGLIDLFIPCHGPEPSMLLHNEGDFVFTSVGPAAGIENTPYDSGATWGDFNLDGWPDLYAPARFYENKLYVNLGNGQFEERALENNVRLGNDPTLQAAFFDYNADGRPDLYLATDKGTNCISSGRHNHLFQNIDGEFVDVSIDTQTDICVDGMTVTVGDLDRNGLSDLYVTNVQNQLENTPNGNALLLQQPGYFFEEVGEMAGVRTEVIGWGAAFFDIDNDAHLDLYVCAGYGPNPLFAFKGEFPVQDHASAYGLDIEGESYTVATGDVDLDGDVDILLSNFNEPLRLLINQGTEIGHWSKIKVVQEDPSQDALGAVIRVRSGDVWQMREVIAGSNYMSQNELIQHFGLGEATIIDEIQVLWTGGQTATFTNMPVDQLLVLSPPVDEPLLGDGDGDGILSLDDHVFMGICLTGPGTSTAVQACSVMDFDGNATIDLRDVAAFQIALREHSSQ